MACSSCIQNVWMCEQVSWLRLSSLINCLKIKLSNAFTAIAKSELAINRAWWHALHAFKILIKTELKWFQASCRDNYELVQKLRSVKSRVRSEVHNHTHSAEQVSCLRLNNLINCLNMKLIDAYTAIAESELAINR
jgi:hypothetical protein